MKNEILDEAVNENNPEFAIKSYNHFIYSILVIVGYVGVIVLSFRGENIGDGLSMIFTLLLFSAFISSIVGLANAVKSKKRKEWNHWKKYVGGVGNLILVLLFLAMIFILFMDIYEVFIK